jgi:hypothetical protein
MRREPARAILAICAAAAMWTPAPAMAKGGPSQGVISGPGLADPIILREPGSATIGADLADVVKGSGFFVGVWGDVRHRLAHPPAGDLGPRYTITYDMSLSDRRSDTITQYVYPYAEPAPITHIPAKQPYWRASETVGPWFAARIGFRQTLIRLGLPASAPSGSVFGDDAAAGSVTPPAGSFPMWPSFAVGVSVLVIATAVTRRRRVGRSVSG